MSAIDDETSRLNRRATASIQVRVAEPSCQQVLAAEAMVLKMLGLELKRGQCRRGGGKSGGKTGESRGRWGRETLIFTIGY